MLQHFYLEYSLGGKIMYEFNFSRIPITYTYKKEIPRPEANIKEFELITDVVGYLYTPSVLMTRQWVIQNEQYNPDKGIDIETYTG
jgi:hypothetical protein